MSSGECRFSQRIRFRKPPTATEKPQAPDTSTRIPYSDEIAGGKLDVKDVIQPTYDVISKKYGLEEKQG